MDTTVFSSQDASANELLRARRNLWEQQYRGRLNFNIQECEGIACALYKVTFRWFFSRFIIVLEKSQKSTCSIILQKLEKISQ